MLLTTYVLPARFSEMKARVAQSSVDRDEEVFCDGEEDVVFHLEEDIQVEVEVHFWGIGFAFGEKELGAIPVAKAIFEICEVYIAMF